ncbi:MAG TPA: BrnT family toxin [Rubneribacter badeniensis]|uniref:BrnT family toxin n=1 Tax=Rubneribacter badeniensis TaxID=2070688 RepID=A0A9D3ACE9_9ACTN|nr:BrnT family toxin [Rubneribacter badeniensis]
MLFEYDPVKSARNRAKHGIDFEQAKRLWSGKVVTVPSLGEYGEVRYVALGVIDGKHWTAVFTRRGERIRIISVRRSRKKEVEVYGEEDQR